MFTVVSEQGSQFEGPLSPSNQYYAFLSKVDLDDTTQLYDVMFEVVAQEWAQNALFSSAVFLSAPPPVSPALIYHIPGIDQNTLVNTLGVTSIDFVAEGSWYLLTFEQAPGGNNSLYHPDIDKQKQS
ncbi:MAG TPA: hypothetical protein VEK57_17605 [Thermoanaerobaculia bacterium]|nr:hypothetical protein [Thermoanaerobaculia bacterium]